MGGTSDLTLEKDINESYPDKGFRTDFGLLPDNLFNWRTDAGLTLTAATTPAIVAVSGSAGSDLFCIRWPYNSQSQTRCAFTMPDEWADDKTIQDWKIFVKLRKVDASDENATLAFKATVSWLADGINPTAALTSQVATSAILAASAANTGPFTEYEIDVGAALRAAGKQIPRGARVTVGISPDADVGTTDMTLEMLSVRDRIRRHAGLKTTTARVQYP